MLILQTVTSNKMQKKFHFKIKSFMTLYSYKKRPCTSLDKTRHIGKLSAGAQKPSYDTSPQDLYSHRSNINFALHDNSNIIDSSKKSCRKQMYVIYKKKSPFGVTQRTVTVSHKTTTTRHYLYEGKSCTWVSLRPAG